MPILTASNTIFSLLTTPSGRCSKSCTFTSRPIDKWASRISCCQFQYGCDLLHWRCPVIQSPRRDRAFAGHWFRAAPSVGAGEKFGETVAERDWRKFPSLERATSSCYRWWGKWWFLQSGTPQYPSAQVRPVLWVIVVEVEKAAVLAMVDQMEAEAVQMEEVLAIAHDEDVSQWIATITHWLRTVPDSSSLLCSLVPKFENAKSWGLAGCTVGRVWTSTWQRKSTYPLTRGLSPLPELRHFQGLVNLRLGLLEQGEEFYSNTLWVKETSVGAG